MNMIFPLLFIGIVGIKLTILYQKYYKIKKNLAEFCNKNNINSNHKLNFFQPELPLLSNNCWKIVWKKQGKSRSFHHILKIYFDFSHSIPEFQIIHKNLLPQMNNQQNWIELPKNLYSSSKEILNYDKIITKISEIQSEYGWGVLEIKNQQAFYSIIAEPYEPYAWEHVQKVIRLLEEFNDSFLLI